MNAQATGSIRLRVASATLPCPAPAKDRRSASKNDREQKPTEVRAGITLPEDRRLLTQR